jgi:gamma-glutamyltranspeptidase/glutathione hydrolase
MVSLTTSLGQAFGSGVVVPNTGVTLNNGMMWFDPEPGHINSIRPGRQAMHAGTPTLIFDEQGPLMALGAPGGRKVLTSVLQCILNTIDYKLGMQEAISAPRIHSESGPLSIDNRMPPDVIAGLEKIGHNIVLREETPITSYYGRPTGILIDRKSELMRSGLQPYNLSTAVGI